MKVYKIVTNWEGKRISFNVSGTPGIDGKRCLLYVPGQPTVGSIGPLFAFRNFITAEQFLAGYNNTNREIWLCDAVFHSYGQYMVSPRRMSLESLIAFWTVKHRPRPWQAPKGTVFCRSITLTDCLWKPKDKEWKPL
jgi:hypothetical protein